MLRKVEKRDLLFVAPIYEFVTWSCRLGNRFPLRRCWEDRDGRLSKKKSLLKCHAIAMIGVVFLSDSREALPRVFTEMTVIALAPSSEFQFLIYHSFKRYQESGDLPANGWFKEIAS